MTADEFAGPTPLCARGHHLRDVVGLVTSLVKRVLNACGSAFLEGLCVLRWACGASDSGSDVSDVRSAMWGQIDLIGGMLRLSVRARVS